MFEDDEELDVLEKPVAKQGAGEKYVISPDAPVLPTLASQGDCELVVSEIGEAAILFSRTMPEGIHWVEYDVDLSILTFVTWSGKVMGLGIKVHRPFRKYLKMAEEIMIIQMSEDKNRILMMYPADLVVRHVGF